MSHVPSLRTGHGRACSTLTLYKSEQNVHDRDELQTKQPESGQRVRLTLIQKQNECDKFSR